MKNLWMLLILALPCLPSPAQADDLDIKLKLQSSAIDGLNGGQQKLALWVEDKRPYPVLGSNTDGSHIIISSDLAVAVRSALSSRLRWSGYDIQLSNVEAPLILNISLLSLDFNVESHALTSTLRLAGKIKATVSRKGRIISERTLSTVNDSSIPFRPSDRLINKRVNEALNDTLHAVFDDASTVSALTKAED